MMSTIHRRLLGSGQFWPFGRTFQRSSVVFVSVVLLVECGLFLTIEPASGYEPSLVTALPLALWACFYIVLFGGILTLVTSFTTESEYWRHGLVLLLANYALFIFLPKVRGYKLYGRGQADVLAHLGWTKEIVESGSLPGSFYPGEHVLLSELTLLGVPFDSITYLAAFLFTTLYILGVGALLKTLSGRKAGLIGGLAAATPLVFAKYHLTTHPSMYSFMLAPVVLLVVERYRATDDDGYLTLFVLLGLMLIYFHPMSTLWIAGMILVVAVYTHVHEFLTGDSIPTLSPRVPVALLPLLFAWLVNYERTTNALREALIREGTPPAALTAQRTTSVDFTPLQLAWKFLTQFGAVALYLAVGGVFALFVLRILLGQHVLSGSVDRVRSSGFRYDWGMVSSQYAIGLFIGVVFLFGSLVVAGRIRILRYALLFATVLVGMGLLHAVRQRDIRVVAVLTVIVLLAGALSANAAYQPARHMTYAEYDGTQFMTANAELGESIYSLDTRHVVERYVLGANDERLFPVGFDEDNDIPDGLGYSSGAATAGETFGRAYLVTKTHDLERPTADYYTDKQQRLLTRYGPEHLDRMHRDRTANKIYTNGGFTGWSVTPRS